MSVLIKGMVMPENCVVCRFWTGKGQNYPYCILLYLLNRKISYDYKGREYYNSTYPVIYQKMYSEKRHDDCPLVELPEKHGRLIDADAFFSRLSVDDYMFSFHVDGVFVDVTKINDVLRHQPTVIEAEGDE